MARELVKRGTERPGSAAYTDLLAAIRAHVEQAQRRVVVKADEQRVMLYWRIGQELLARLDARDWGRKSEVVAQLPEDLGSEFPGMGLSGANLYKMRRFAAAWPARGDFFSTLLRKISWAHNLVLLEKLDEPEERLWYAQKAIECGWSSRVLTARIASGLRERQGHAETNFELVLPQGESELVQEILKSEYNLEFLRLLPGVRERELEDGLVSKVQQMLQELGGPLWSFCGRQHRLVVDGDEYFIDLLFFHRGLRRLIVVDLKIEEFKPEFAGKMSFYQAAVDEQLRQPDEHPSIGLILCTGGNQTVVKYSLQGVTRPIGVSRYSLGDEEGLPSSIRDQLPSEGELQASIEEVVEDVSRLQLRQ